MSVYEEDTASISSSEESDLVLELEPSEESRIFEEEILLDVDTEEPENVIFIDENGVPYEPRYLTEAYTEEELAVLIQASENSEFEDVYIEDFERLEGDYLLDYYRWISIQGREP